MGGYDDAMGEAAAPVKKAADGTLTSLAGMTLYTFDKDASGKSACNGGCAKSWPPLLAGAQAKAGGEWSIIGREDGTRQWAHEGKPLYAWVKDQKPGDKTGDGFLNNQWHVARD
ncbi:MAG TPA: hypothetical protein VF059_11370 [Casimicrobiaceae bacterium]